MLTSLFCCWLVDGNVSFPNASATEHDGSPFQQHDGSGSYPEPIPASESVSSFHRGYECEQCWHGSVSSPGRGGTGTMYFLIPALNALHNFGLMCFICVSLCIVVCCSNSWLPGALPPYANWAVSYNSQCKSWKICCLRCSGEYYKLFVGHIWTHTSGFAWTLLAHFKSRITVKWLGKVFWNLL